MSPELVLILGGAALSFGASVLLTPVAMTVARRTGYLDRPGAHKSHDRATPYGGGVAIALASWLPLGVTLALAQSGVLSALATRLGPDAVVYADGLALRLGPGWVLLAGGMALHLLGLLDDLRPLSAWPKLAIMLAVAAAVVWLADLRVAVSFLGPTASAIITVLWIGVIVNAFNFLDNMDGLSAGVAAICLVFLVICGLLAGQVLVPAMGALFCGAVLGFLVYNFPPAKVFMGDAGSLLVGYMLAVLSVRTQYYDSAAGGPPPYSLAMPLIVLAVPLYDFVSVVLIRVREGRSPWRGDQRHFSHRLLDHGLSRRSAVLTIYLATATTGVAATLLPTADLRVTLSVVAVTIMTLAIIAILETPVRRQDRS